MNNTEVRLAIFLCILTVVSMAMIFVKVWSMADKVEEQMTITRALAAKRSIQSLTGKQLMEKTDCYACHQLNTKLVGPSFQDIALTYKKSDAIISKLAKNVKKGAIGVWGNIPMSPHPTLSMDEIKVMVSWILDQSESDQETSPTDPLALLKHTVAGNIKRGEMIVNTHCAPCHQFGGVGKVGVAPSIRNRDFLALASDEFIKKTIREGRPKTSMVPRKDLSDQSLEDIIAYLRALPNPLPSKVQVNDNKKVKGYAKKGKVLYANYCASCHGERGQGYVAGGSGPGIGLKGFLQTASDDYIFQTVKHGRVGTAMRSFIGSRGLANLSENDVYDIIAHLRELGE